MIPLYLRLRMAAAATLTTHRIQSIPNVLPAPRRPLSQYPMSAPAIQSRNRHDEAARLLPWQHDQRKNANHCSEIPMISMTTPSRREGNAVSATAVLLRTLIDNVRARVVMIFLS
jgi:hypothetical protein